MSGLSKERILYLQKVVKKEVVQCPPEKKLMKRKQGRYWYLEKQEHMDWGRWVNYVNSKNEELSIKYKVGKNHFDYWDNPRSMFMDEMEIRKKYYRSEQFK